MSADKAAIHAYLAEHFDAHVERIQDFIREASVSPERIGLDSCAAFVAESLRSCGCEAGVVDVGDGLPGVFGRIDSGAAETLLIYSHYDVRPVGAEPWAHAPFSGDLVPFAGFAKTVIGRGAAIKGPLQGFFNAVGAIGAVEGKLPVNLVFLIEGAEIVGSPNYPKLVEKCWDDVKKATAIYGPRATQDGAGTVGINLGYKGLIYLELIAGGSAWGRGPQGAAVHSATNAVVDNPAWRLVQALATMVDADGTIAIPALRAATQQRKPIVAWERALLTVLEANMAKVGPNGVIPGLSPQSPVQAFKGGANGAALLEDYVYGPSMNISGLRSGYTGAGTKPFLLPATATATLDMRVVSETPAAELLGFIRTHLDSHGFADIAINPFCAYDWNQTAIDAPLVQCALTTLDTYGCPTSIWPMQAFGGPWAHYGKALGIPSLQGAAPGHGGRVQTSDEFYVIEGNEKVAGLLELEQYFVDFICGLSI